jgi:hypothetical protein
MYHYLIRDIVWNGFGYDLVASSWVYDINGMVADSKKAVVGLELAKYLHISVSLVRPTPTTK